MDRNMDRHDDGRVQKRPKFSARQKQILIFSVTLLLLIVVAIVYRETNPDEQQEAKIATDYEKAIETKTAYELFKYGIELENEFESKDLMSKLEFLNKQIEIASKVEEIEAENSMMANKASLVQMTMINRLARLHFKNQLGDLNPAYLSYLKKKLVNENDDVRHKAHLGRCFMSIFEFVSAPSDDSSDNLNSTFLSAFKNARENPDLTSQIVDALFSEEVTGGREDRSEMCESLSTYLIEQQVPDLVDVGNRILSKLLLKKFDVSKIVFDLEMQTSESASKANEFVEQFFEAR